MAAISVVIPTHDRPAGLRRTLDGLARQTLRDFDVIVVDDAGKHPATETLEGRRYPFDLRIVRLERNSGPAHARNRGVSEAAGAARIAFLDDDVVPIPEFLARHRQASEAAGPASVIIGPQLAPADWHPTPWNRWEAESLAIEYGRMEAGVYEPTWRQFFTGNAFLQRGAFLGVGGFDETFTRAEDIEFAYRLQCSGAKFVFEPNAIGWHYSRRTLASWRSIPRNYAHFDAEIDRLHPDLHWLATLDKEARGRHPGSRLASWTCRTLHLERAGATAAIIAAAGLDRVKGHRPASALLSLAFSLEYASVSRDPRPGKAANSPSTEPPRLPDTVGS